jgi:hypothetical protein
MEGGGGSGSSKAEKAVQDLFRKAFTNEKTRENYISRLNGMLRQTGAVTVMEVAKDPATWYPRIQSAYPTLSTRRNLLTALLVLFREDADLAANDAVKARWKKLHEDLGRHADARVRRSEPEDKQIAKYTSFEEIEAKYEELRRGGTAHKTRLDSLQFLLLSIIVHLRPKRADLGAVHVFMGRDPNRTDINYVVLRTEGKAATGSSFLSMNMYKTSKHYKKVEEELPEGLVRDMRASLKRWPREYLFVKDAEKGRGGKEPMSNATYSAFVQRTFEALFGRATGVSLLRHIYISEKLDLDNMTLEEQEEEARLMLHTSVLQRQYKWPKKVICPKLCADYVGEARAATRKKPRHGTLKDGTRRRLRRAESGTL